jgi:hypothetical protein
MTKKLGIAFAAAMLATTTASYAGCEMQETGYADVTGVYVCQGCQNLAELQHQIRIVQVGSAVKAQATNDVTVHSMTISGFKITWGSVIGTVRNNCSTISWSNNTNWLKIN